MPHSLCSPILLAALSAACALPALGAPVPHSSAPPIDPPTASPGQRADNVPDFKVAAGFKVSVAIDAPSESRFLQFDNFNHLYVSGPKRGTITSYQRSPDGSFQKIAVVASADPRKASGLQAMEFVDGWLWYCTSRGVFKAQVREDGKSLDNLTTVLEEGSIPGGGGHWFRPILVGPDGFYTAMGDARNFSDVSDPQIIKEEGPHSEDREKIWKYALDGKSRTLFASGIRNTEKLLFRPGTSEVWGLDHGSDNFGLLLGDDIGHNQPITDNIPGEEVNHYEQGNFYGHPFIADNNLIRPEYNTGGPNARPDIKELLAKAVPPVYMFPAHWANCGWTFLTKDSPLGKKGDLFLAAHGSWDSVARKVGYCIAKLPFSPDGKPGKAQVVVYCLAADGDTPLGRPVDIIEEPGTDNLVFSVDVPKARVYRISPVATK